MNFFRRLASEMLRIAERWLPIPALRVLLLPVALAMALRELTSRPDFLLRRLWALPKGLRVGVPRGAWLWRIWTGRVPLSMNRILVLWSERLREPQWSLECEIRGMELLQAALETGRPVILATCHFGDLTLLYMWLRSRGLQVAFLVARQRRGASPYREALDSLADRVNGLTGVPRLINADSLWDARDFLDRPGRILGIAMDGKAPHSVTVQGPSGAIRMTPGALRLAAVVNALVIPCLISAPQSLRSRICIGTPVPDADVACRDRHILACEHIVRELSGWIAERPEQCGKELISAFRAAKRLAGDVKGEPRHGIEA
jgi:lauroyl/myristoyl acyltransferase